MLFSVASLSTVMGCFARTCPRFELVGVAVAQVQRHLLVGTDRGLYLARGSGSARSSTSSSGRCRRRSRLLPSARKGPAILGLVRVRDRLPKTKRRPPSAPAGLTDAGSELAFGAMLPNAQLHGIDCRCQFHVPDPVVCAS